MRKMLSVLLAIVLISTMSFNVTAFAATTRAVNYYDEHGNFVTINGMYYNSNGYPMFNASCYYTDANGNPVYVGGCRAYYYNANGDLTAGNYYYDANGNAVNRPASYPGGWGCGAYYNNAQGNAVNNITYYDDFGNPVEPPVTQTPINHHGGRCHGWW